MFQFKELLRQPSITIIGNVSLVERIDAGYYHASHLEQLNKVISRSSKKLCDIVDITKLSGFEFTEHFTKLEIASKEIPCVMSQNVRDNDVDLSQTIFITKKTHQELIRSQLHPGDIVLSYTGHYRRAAVIKHSDCPIHLGPNVCKLTPKSVDPYFVSSYLNSFHGQALLDREKTISAQPTVNMARIRELDIIEVEALVQKYIGDKIRQAERLRAWGKAQYAIATSSFERLVKEYGYTLRKNEKSVWAKLDCRLDPAYYNPKYSFLDEEWFVSKSKPLSTFIKEGAYGVLPDSSSYGTGDQRFIRATDIKLSNIDPTAFTFVPADQVSLKARVNTNDILLEIKGAIETCELAGEALNGTYVNGSIYRFTPKEIAPGYLAFYLRSFIKQLYCERVSVNNIISYLDLGSLNSLPVLRFDTEHEELIEQSFLRHLDAARLSFRLTSAAKFFVEALIEGLLTETELIAAEQALQVGNDQLDRSILSRLKTDGVDGKGQPLFSDLDELYRLLAQACQD